MRCLSLCFALIAMLTAAPALAWDIKAMNEQIDQTNFMVNVGCSGTLIDEKNGYVLTANHCIMDQYEVVEHQKIDANGKVTIESIRVAKPGTVSQIFYNGPSEVQRVSYVFKIKASDAALDLALLQVQTKLPNTGAAHLSCKDVVRGSPVYAVGNSFGILYSTVTNGIVSSVHRSYRDMSIAGQLGDLTDAGDHGLVQHSAAISGGNSGGALYNDAGGFVGVNVRGAQQSGFSFAVPLSDVKAFLKSANIDVACNAP